MRRPSSVNLRRLESSRGRVGGFLDGGVAR
jgi:hypothetical protein